jgi:antitoxin VapB
MTIRAKLFMHGRSQAVRLPKAFRFNGDEVRITKIGDRVILEPLQSGPRRIPWDLIDALGDEPFMPEGREDLPAPDEPSPFDE